ncbi:MAG: type II toxin-antitoxin system PemK/MazF family toxin [Proteobacteria bacterium]|nr:type II toxin-antitoxin system PemK/MazF family toxin [Pseudomonadota bacterium]
MTSSIPCNRGDVVLVPFKFADNDNIKRRPGIVVSVSAYHGTRADAIFVGLTTQGLNRQFFGDYVIRDWRAAGLPRQSKAKGVIQTIDRSVVVQRIGTLTPEDMTRLEATIRAILGL